MIKMNYQNLVEISVINTGFSYQYKVKADPSEVVELQYTEKMDGVGESTTVIGFTCIGEMERIANAMLKACATAKRMNP